MSWKPFKDYTPKERAISDALCRKGSLRHLLNHKQREFYDAYHANKHKDLGLYTSRKCGKTFVIVCIYMEHCYLYPNQIMKIVLSTLKMAKDVIYPIYNELRGILPKGCLPKLIKSETAFEFNNKSRLLLGGGHPDNIENSRGPLAHGIALDEIASWDGDVSYALNSILFPQLTTTKGRVIYATTPPANMDCHYLNEIHPKLLKTNSIVTFNIYENPLLDKEDIRLIIERSGGVDSPSFKREYLCELIPRNDLRLTPNFYKHLHTFPVDNPPPNYADFGDGKLPVFYTTFVTGDVGAKDWTVLLAGYYDHVKNKLVILDEWVDGQDGHEKGNARHLVEKANEFKYDLLRPYMFDSMDYKEHHVSVDMFAMLKSQLELEYNFSFFMPLKRKVEDSILYLCSCLESEKIVISEKCKNLIWELQNAQWKDNDGRLTIERMINLSHADLIMSLIYMLRLVNWGQIPGAKNHEMYKKMKKPLHEHLYRKTQNG